MKSSIPTAALVILAAAAPVLGFSPGVGVRLWTEYEGKGDYFENQNEGNCVNVPGWINDRFKSIAIYPTGYHCDFWLDANCNNNGPDGTKCSHLGGGPDRYNPGITNVRGYFAQGCSPVAPFTSFKCYKP